MNIGDRVSHVSFGSGVIVTSPNEQGFVHVTFDREHEVIVGEVIDLDYYFEDNRHLETTSFIDVHQSELKLIKSQSARVQMYENPHCHSCGKLLYPQSHPVCGKCSNEFYQWLICECGSCGCNYVPKQPL